MHVVDPAVGVAVAAAGVSPGFCHRRALRSGWREVDAGVDDRDHLAGAARAVPGRERTDARVGPEAPERSEEAVVGRGRAPRSGSSAARRRRRRGAPAGRAPLRPDRRRTRPAPAAARSDLLELDPGGVARRGALGRRGAGLEADDRLSRRRRCRAASSRGAAAAADAGTSAASSAGRIRRASEGIQHPYRRPRGMPVVCSKRADRTGERGEPGNRTRDGPPARRARLRRHRDRPRRGGGARGSRGDRRPCAAARRVRSGLDRARRGRGRGGPGQPRRARQQRGHRLGLRRFGHRARLRRDPARARHQLLRRLPAHDRAAAAAAPLRAPAHRERVERDGRHQRDGRLVARLPRLEGGAQRHDAHPRDRARGGRRQGQLGLPGSRGHRHGRPVRRHQAGRGRRKRGRLARDAARRRARAAASSATAARSLSRRREARCRPGAPRSGCRRRTRAA